MAEPKAGGPATGRPPPRAAGLTRWERRALLAFAALAVVFGGLVELRSAFLRRRMGDLGVFLRAGWAVRAGADLYACTDNNGFHYQYPPLLAILVTPLADPPPGAARAGTLPYPASVALWYAAGLACLAFAVHRLAGALEEGGGGPAALGHPPRSRGWWALRVLPVVACVIPVGHTLMRGQVNLLLLALLCGCLAAVLRGQRFRAGLWLAAAVCLKVIPAFLLLFPLWRRDGRLLAGCALGLLVGLVAVPVAALGPARTRACYRELAEAVLLPGLGAGTDESRALELTNVTATDSQSILAVLHNTRYPEFARRPPKASAAVRLASYALGGLLTLATLLAAGWHHAGGRVSEVLFFGALVLDMLLLSPVCHLHYFALAVPLVMGLLADRWQRREALWPGAGLVALFLANGVAGLLPNLPHLDLLRDCGSAMYGSLLLWAAGVGVLRRRRRPAEAPVAERPAVAA